MTPYIAEFKTLIKAARIEPAKKHLTALHEKPAAEKQKAIEIIALAPEKTALELLPVLVAGNGSDPDIRERLLQVVTDRAHIDFSFARILAAYGGRERLMKAAPLFKHILTRETDKDLLATLLRTAGKYGLTPLMDETAEFIFYDDPALKAEAVRALERIGGQDALERLRKVARTEKCDQDILDAIYILETRLDRAEPDQPKTPARPADPVPAPLPKPGPAEVQPQPAPRTVPKQTAQKEPPGSYEEHIARLSSPALSERYKAFDFFTEKGDQVAKALAANLSSPDHNLLVCLLRLVSRTIPQSAEADLLNLVSGDKIPSAIKFAAYDALYAYPEIESAAALIKGITDGSAHVRMAAVKVLGKNVSDFVIAEIRSKIESGTKTGETLAKTLLDAGEKGLIEALMASDSFTYIASNYLEKNASVAAMDAFISVLEKRNRKSTAMKYKQLRDEKAARNRESIMVLSPSPVYLDVYNKLICAAGFFCRPFTGTQDAFESLVSQKPAAVVCDPFLNNMTAVDFTVEARELYTPGELPVIISMIQKGLDKTILTAELEKAGVTGCCDFPARSATIRSWVKPA